MTEQSTPRLDHAATAAISPLYAKWAPVYVRAVMGPFRRLKWLAVWVLLGAYYVVPWLRWDRGEGFPDQAVLLDIAGRRVYLFGLEIWPQELYYLTGLLIIAAIGLFLATSLFGRLWCGYGCPQTVWTDLFQWVERRIEGDRNARMRLDKGPWTAAKVAKKTAKHGVWMAISVVTAAAWVFFFTDAPSTAAALIRGEASVTVYSFVALFTASTYVMAGWAREQFCTYLCPWPRLQAPMLDEHSLIVSYDAARGEPRRSRKARTTAALPGQSLAAEGACIDCSLCVQVCPTGIDIRDGAQQGCINCGLCVDACNKVMDQIGAPRDLIAWTSLAGQKAKAAQQPYKVPFLRRRVVIYATILAAVAGVMVTAFSTRTTLEVNVLRDRAPVYVPLSDGTVRNAYTLKVLNKTRAPRTLTLTSAGLTDAELEVIGADGTATATTLHVGPDTVATYRAFVTAPPQDATDSTPIDLRLEDTATGAKAIRRTVFIAPPAS